MFGCTSVSIYPHFVVMQLVLSRPRLRCTSGRVRNLVAVFPPFLCHHVAWTPQVLRPQNLLSNASLPSIRRSGRRRVECGIRPRVNFPGNRAFCAMRFEIRRGLSSRPTQRFGSRIRRVAASCVRPIACSSGKTEPVIVRRGFAGYPAPRSLGRFGSDISSAAVTVTGRRRRHGRYLPRGVGKGGRDALRVYSLPGSGHLDAHRGPSGANREVGGAGEGYASRATRPRGSLRARH